MSFLLLFGLAIALLGGTFIRGRVKARRLARLDFDGLISRLKPVHFPHIATIAVDYLQPAKGQLQINPEDLWTLMGKDEGARRIYANAEILLALAGYAQRWNLEESVIVAERMRRDAMTLRRAAVKLQLGSIGRHRGVLTAFNVQEVASSYFLMRKRLLALYETSHAGKYPALLAAL